MSENYGDITLLNQQGKLNPEIGLPEFKDKYSMSLHEWSQEEFPHEKHFSGRREPRALNGRFQSGER